MTMTTSDQIVVDLGKVVEMFIRKDTPCAHCKKNLNSKKKVIYLNSFGVLHEACYKELVRASVALARS